MATIDRPRLARCATPPASVRRRVGAALAATALVGSLLMSASVYAAGDDSGEGPAWTLADQAYKAYAAGDFAASAAKAREAVALRPDIARWQLLLINALEAAGRLDEAEAAISAAMAKGVVDPTLAPRRAAIRKRLAAVPARAAVEALAKGDAGAAVPLAQQAVDLAPDQLPDRLLLIDALTRAGRTAVAEGIAAATVAQNPLLALPRLLHAVLLQRLGRVAAAMAEYAKALSAPGLAAAEARTYRLIAVDGALAAGDARQALEWLKPLAGDRDPAVSERRAAAEALQKIGRAYTAAPPQDYAPRQECQDTPSGLVCTLMPRDLPGPAPQAVANPAPSAAASPAAPAAPDVSFGPVPQTAAPQAAGPQATPVQASAPQAGAPQAAAPQANAGYAAADAAYKAFAQRDYVTATIEARKAVALEPDNAGYRLLLLNTLTAQRKLGEAEAVADAAVARNPRDAALLAQRGYLRQQLKRSAAAADDFTAALATGRLPVGEVRGVRLALADAAMAAKQPARALDALAPLARERSYDVAARRSFALQALGQHDEALAAFDLGASLARTPAERSTMTSGAIGELVALGRKDEAKARFTQAVSAGTLSGMKTLDLAYLASQVGDTATAYAYFHQAEEEGSLRRGPALVDAAYAAKRTFHNAEAVSLLEQAIDANADGKLPLPAQTLFGLRREAADISRTWGAYASVSYGAVGVAPSSPLAPPPSGGNTIQGGAEVYWRPPGIGYQNGAIFEVFGRVFQTWYDETGGATGATTTQGSVGVRWKPISDQNLIFEVSRLFPIGALAREDVLFRVAYSTGDGTDLRADVPDWNYWQVYGELDYFTQTPETLGNFEARWGRSYRLDPLSTRVVVTPFIAIGGAYDSLLATPGTLAAGPGLTVRNWFREDTYRAPMSYLDLTAQYRIRLAGDDRGGGWFAGAFLSY